MIVNIPVFVDFSAHLPQKSIKVDFYGRDSGYALPTCCLTLNHIRQNFEMVDNLTKFICVQKLNFTTNVWEEQHPSSVNLPSLVTVGGGKGLTPEVWGKYVIVTNDERDCHQEQIKDILIQQVQKYSSARNPAGFVRLYFYFSYLMRYLLFNPWNRTASDINNLSNYTTESIDYETGLDPVNTVSLYYENTPRFPGDHFYYIEPYYHAQRVPTETVYHVISYCLKINTFDPDSSTDYSKLTSVLVCNLVETSTNVDYPVTPACQYTV